MIRSRLLRLAFASAMALHGSMAIAATAPYQPQDDDERGLWMQVDKVERDLKTSDFVIRDEKLNAYVNAVLCRTVGPDECGQARIYLMRTPYFNASMAPNGMMQIWSGLLLRTDNEAQLAAVLAHEFAHYKERHSVQLFRDIKHKTNASAWLSMVPFGFVAQLGIGLSMFSFSREMEREADARSVEYMAAAGYDPRQASLVWQRLRAEMDATAAERKIKSRKDKNGGLFASHPPTAERVVALQKHASINAVSNGRVGSDSYRAALAPFWADFVDDQINLNDFGASEYLLNALASGGWSGELLYARAELYRARGKPEDFGQAALFYQSALDNGFTRAESWRGLGLSLIRSGQREAGKAALQRYLKESPAAGDRDMIAMMAGGD